MSDSVKDYRPLLHEDHLDEEFQHDFNTPLRRYMGYRGKARNTIKGAAAIIKDWPDHWSSSITYWWMGVAMIGLITFIFYNSLATYSMLPAADSTPIPQFVAGNKIEIKQKLTFPKIYMHVIVNNKKEVDFNKYLPYVEIIANKYLHYKFYLIFMHNDTITQEPTHEALYQAQMNNEEALNSLWTEHHVLEFNRTHGKIKSNINMEYINLSEYLNDSPIRNYWKNLPHQFIEFLVRAVSIWDQGGIALSPIILTPKSPDPIYIEKLFNLLSSYEEFKKPNATKTIVDRKVQNIEKPQERNSKRKHKKKVNNIRDIIDALETETTSSESLDALSEAENRQELTQSVLNQLNTEPTVLNYTVKVTSTEREFLEEGHLLPKNRSKILTMMFPTFLDFLFHDKQESIMPVEDCQENLTIDLKGYLLATKSPCHAFLGTIFSNVQHRTEEKTLKEFIISELSLFCNGLLSTCKGIDVMLL